MQGRGRVLLIGGSGFIGTALSGALTAAGVDVAVVDHVLPREPGVTYLGADIDRVPDGDLEGVDTLVHLAWSTKIRSADGDPVFDLESNVVAGVRLLDRLAALPRTPRLIFLSSGGAVYGVPERLPISEDQCPRPLTAYGIGKWTFEQYLHLYARARGLDYLVLRPGNPYGEGQDPEASQGAVTVFLGRLAAGRPIDIWGDGGVVRDYLHVDDLSEALLRCLDYRPGVDEPRTFNLGSGHGISLNDLIERISAVVGQRPEVRYHSGRAVDVPAIVLDCGVAERQLGWRTRIGIDEGLRRTWAWVAGRVSPA